MGSDQIIEIHAELFFDDKKNGFLKKLPPGVTIKRKGNSRSCIFEWDDNLTKEALIEILDSNQVCYQEMN